MFINLIKSLKNNASLIPNFTLQRIKKVIGKNTLSALRSGNISSRYKNGFLITPSGKKYSTLKNKDIVEAINNVWDINCKYFYGVENMISKNQKLQMHNDYYGDKETPNNPFVRGVIYCNPEYVFGTEIYDNPDADKPYKIVGGNPGSLFLFRTGPTSWHSAVNSDNKQNRIVCSMKATTFK